MTPEQKKDLQRLREKFPGVSYNVEGAEVVIRLGFPFTSMEIRRFPVSALGVVPG